MCQKDNSDSEHMCVHYLLMNFKPLIFNDKSKVNITSLHETLLGKYRVHLYLFSVVLTSPNESSAKQRSFRILYCDAILRMPHKCLLSGRSFYYVTGGTFVFQLRVSQVMRCQNFNT